MAVSPFNMGKQAQRGDWGQQARPGTRLYLWGLWGFFFTVALLPGWILSVFPLCPCPLSCISSFCRALVLPLVPAVFIGS